MCGGWSWIWVPRALLAKEVNTQWFSQYSTERGASEPVDHAHSPAQSLPNSPRHNISAK
jgi:hypothetical protein